MFHEKVSHGIVSVHILSQKPVPLPLGLEFESALECQYYLSLTRDLDSDRVGIQEHVEVSVFVDHICDRDNKSESLFANVRILF